MTQTERFLKNLAKWKTTNEDAAYLLENLEVCKNIELCKNDEGDLNLKDQTVLNAYLHSYVSPEREARQWFLSLNLQNIYVLYVYGIGLGYYYDVVKAWLKEDSKRSVIFIEDDLEVMRHFLDTERANDLLSNPQVKLFYYTPDQTLYVFSFITSLYPLIPFSVTSLKYYAKKKPQQFSEFYARIAYFHDMRLGISAEFLNLGSNVGFLGNFYKNLLLLPSSKLAWKMGNQFKGTPAIICGAGPSLAKNIDFLRTLQDKALIMAGGTAMNVLNGAGIMPHFGVGIDPNPAHYNRLISNTAFEEPFFYRQRMYNPALKAIHGERIFVTGSGGYKISEWFEKKLDVQHSEMIEEGHNVVNFNIGIAKFLGCNPIIVVGVDLAYSNDNSYAPGLVRHALHDPKDAFITKYSHEELLIKNDIDGNPVRTLWKWVNESMWFTHFAEMNSDITLLNCTEGGIGFSKVQNLKLAEAAEKYLRNDYDFASSIHGLLQNSGVPADLTLEKILNNYEIFARSLLACESLCTSIILAYNQLIKEHELDDVTPTIVNTEKIDEDIKKFELEEGYLALLQDYKARYLEILFPHFLYIEIDSQFNTEKEIWIKKIHFQIGLYTFLLKTARYNMNHMANILNDYINDSKKPPLKPLKKTIAMQEMILQEREKALKKDVYEYKNQRLKIYDEELGLDHSVKGEWEENTTSYENGIVKSISYHFKGVLNGPTSFYAPNGQLLAKNWYLNGKLEGKGWFYYDTGELYALKRSKNGLYEGRQEFYYKNGLPKSVLFYKNGLLDGNICLYHPNGKMKREMDFKNGKKDGYEYFWNEDGILIIEACYEQDIPVGVAREWNANGNLAKEITYKKDSDQFEIKTWDIHGKPEIDAGSRKGDYFDNVTGQTKMLTESLQNMYQSLVGIAPSINMDKKGISTSVEEDLLVLKIEMDKLAKFGHEMLVQVGHEGTNPKEALWKTPETERLVRGQVDNATKELAESIKDMHENLRVMIEKMNEKINQSNPPNEKL